jgi:aspartyl aminopeptidase
MNHTFNNTPDIASDNTISSNNIPQRQKIIENTKFSDPDFQNISDSSDSGLTLVRKSAWYKCTDLKEQEIHKFAEEYKKFLNCSKTERLFVYNTINVLQRYGFMDITLNCPEKGSLKPGDRVYKNIKGKALAAAVIGSDPDSAKIAGAHIDSPRLDLKPSPLYEESDFAMMKTHYYGGIKKHVWTGVPLAMIGIVYLKDGSKIDISIGNSPDEPKFIIPDLSTHLDADQMKSSPDKIIKGGQMNIICGNTPIKDEKVKNSFKMNVLYWLNQRYGMVEEDFNFAELELVPAALAQDIGFDSSMIAAYGQDDKICAYTALKGLLDMDEPAHTAVLFLTDKEETGSGSNTGADSFALENFIKDICTGLDLEKPAYRVLEDSCAVSGDVVVSRNPNFKSATEDDSNITFLGRGVTIQKYGGAKGKSSTNDAHAEYLSKLRTMLDNNNIAWQTGEFGTIDLGGGGTIARLLGRFGMDVVDAGPGILDMHSPCEVTSKIDLYHTYKFFKTFLCS